MYDLHDRLEDSTVRIFFTTNDGSGGRVAPSSPFEAADIRIYKDGSAIQKTTDNGVTMTSPFDTETGLHLVEIDTSNDTGDAGFWTTGSDFTVILAPDETIDGQSVVSVLAQFAIENRPIPAAYKTNFSLSAAGIDAILDEVIEAAVTLRSAVNAIWAVICGDAQVSAGDGKNPEQIQYDSPDGSVDVTHTFTGNRETRTRS